MVSMPVRISHPSMRQTMTRVALAATMFTTVAHADDADGVTGDAVAADAAAAEEKAPVRPTADALFQEQAGLEDVPSSQYVAKSEESIQEMRKNLQRGLSTLKDAREAKDAVRLNCVNDKITAMKGILRISEDAFISLQEAMVSNAPEKARYEFGKIRVSRKKMAQDADEAGNCAGAEASYTGGTEISLEIDEAVVGGDAYYSDTSFFATPEDTVANNNTDGVGSDDTVDTRPPPASPFQ